MQTETLNIILTIFNLIIASALAFITYKYTKATEVIAKLEEGKKIWDVLPVIVPFKKFNHDRQRHEYGLKNIGRGIAQIKKLKIEPTKGNDDWSRNRSQYTIPIFLGLSEEFIYTHTIDAHAVEFNQQIIEVEYTDIHENRYSTTCENGVIKTGKI